MRKIIIALVFTLKLLNVAAQEADTQKNLLTEVSKMGKAFIAKDYSTFANYAHPRVVKTMGGRANMIENVKKGIEGLEQDGIKVLDVDYGEPSKIYKVDNTLQCTLVQMIKLKVKGGKLTSNSVLLAISENDGKNWYFLDTAGFNLPTMKSLIPNLSDELVIPGKMDPVFEPDEETTKKQ